MLIFQFIGFFLILLGIASGVAIFTNPFGYGLQGSEVTMWVFFVMSFIGGFVLYAMGSSEGHKDIIKTAGSLLLIIGLMSAMGIFIDKVGIIHANGTFSLWLLFIVCTLSGVGGVVASSEIQN